MSETATPAMDIRLMNATAAVLLGVFVLLGLVSAARWVARLPGFDIQRITVRGDVVHNNIPSMRANVLPRMQGTFFTVNLTATRESYESMPWVRKAVVRREFPNRRSAAGVSQPPAGRTAGTPTGCLLGCRRRFAHAQQLWRSV